MASVYPGKYVLNFKCMMFKKYSGSSSESLNNNSLFEGQF